LARLLRSQGCTGAQADKVKKMQVAIRTLGKFMVFHVFILAMHLHSLSPELKRAIAMPA
jgi:hypothetical protein